MLFLGKFDSIIFNHSKAPKVFTMSYIIITKAKTLIGLVEHCVNYTYLILQIIILKFYFTVIFYCLLNYFLILFGLSNNNITY